MDETLIPAASFYLPADWNPKHVSLRALEVVAQTETLKEVPQIDEHVPHGAVGNQKFNLFSVTFTRPNVIE